jgi:hypothetical protein
LGTLSLSSEADASSAASTAEECVQSSEYARFRSSKEECFGDATAGDEPLLALLCPLAIASLQTHSVTTINTCDYL